MRAGTGSGPAGPDPSFGLATVASVHLAIDLGAESGRAFVASVGNGVELREIGRFRNLPQRRDGRVAWNMPLIRDFISDALGRCGPVDSVSIDSWAVDFGLLDSEGGLIAPPRCYRDPFNVGALDLVLERISASDLYNRTGIQLLEINTICQLAALAARRPAELAEASKLLMIPDLLRLWMGGEAVSERTNASTTQMLAPSGEWDPVAVAASGAAMSILPVTVESYEVVGRCSASLGGVPIVAGASHDTAAAVAGTPLRSGEAFLSSGTWSLLGLELPAPVISRQAQRLNLSNEHGVAGTTRLLRNVMGLWMVQQSRRAWALLDGFESDYADLAGLAASASIDSIVDPDAALFVRPEDMTAAIDEYCVRTGQRAPGSRGETLRCILQSLALRYRWVIEALELVTGSRVTTLRVVGGGSQNELLCQLTADAAARPVQAGPVEATVLGNVMVQAVVQGTLPDLAAGRAIIETSLAPRIYQPSQDLEPAYQRFCALPGVGRPSG